jgi:hypothetical protein
LAGELSAEDLLEDESLSNRADDLDKAWHAIHFLLTRTAGEAQFPLGFLSTGGTVLSDDPIDRVFSAADVQEIAKALEPITWPDLARRYNPAALARAGIYPKIWHRQDEDHTEYLEENYSRLREAVLLAAQRGQALLTSLG